MACTGLLLSIPFSHINIKISYFDALPESKRGRLLKPKRVVARHSVPRSERQKWCVEKWAGKFANLDRLDGCDRGRRTVPRTRAVDNRLTGRFALPNLSPLPGRQRVAEIARLQIRRPIAFLQFQVADNRLDGERFFGQQLFSRHPQIHASLCGRGLDQERGFIPGRPAVSRGPHRPVLERTLGQSSEIAVYRPSFCKSSSTVRSWWAAMRLRTPARVPILIGW